MRKRKAKLPVAAARSTETDPALVQAIVDRRLALRFGVSLPVAATVAALAGLGPHSGRAAR